MNDKSYTPNPGYQPWRMYIIYGLIILIFGFFVVRLFSLQIVQGVQYLERANQNRTNEVSVPTQRGIIYDRNGFVLARNVASYNVTITPASLPADDGAIQAVYRQLSDLIGVPVNHGTTDETTVKLFKPCDTELGITQIVYIARTNAPYDPVRVRCNIDQKIAMTIQERASDLPGVAIEIEPVRDYPTGELTSDIIGFLGPIPAATEKYYTDLGFMPNRDKVGFAGIELSEDDQLLGKNGKRVVEVDVAGQEIRNLEPPVAPVPGNNITLTIDTRLQTAARTALLNEMAYWNRIKPELGLSNGVVIAMNPKTGEILAMVSEPSYENNRLSRQIPFDYYKQLSNDPQNPLFNQAISSELAPGSVFKMATAVGILNEGVVTPDKIVQDPGKITVLQKFTANDTGVPIDFVCYIYKSTGEGHGAVNFLKGVAQSCDVYFYKVGGGYQDEVPNGGLNIWRIGEYAKALGYGEKTGIELPGEAAGLIPDPNWKRINLGESWATGDTYIATIGQGYVVATPLQVLDSIATLANDGKFMQPTLIKSIQKPDGTVTPNPPKLKWDITKDAKIHVYDENNFQTGELKTVSPSAIALAKEGMREVVTTGTSSAYFEGFSIPSAGKTGTAEYCDDVANRNNKCNRGRWPAHAWYAGYAPYDNPEIAVVAFVYNGTEGSTVASPIVRQVMEAYFELKTIDAAKPAGQ